MCIKKISFVCLAIFCIVNIACLPSGGKSRYSVNQENNVGGGDIGKHDKDEKSIAPDGNVCKPYTAMTHNANNIIAAGAGHSLWIDENGELWSWGYNYYGQLGRTLIDGRTNDKNPMKVQVYDSDAKLDTTANASPWVGVTAGANDTIA